MTERPDELERLKAALQGATPEPDPAARARALQAARSAFQAQGSALEARPKRNRPHWAVRLFGGWTMHLPTLRQTFYGGASLAVITLAFVLLQDPAILDPRSEPAMLDEKPEPKPADEAAMAPAADQLTAHEIRERIEEHRRAMQAQEAEQATRVLRRVSPHDVARQLEFAGERSAPVAPSARLIAPAPPDRVVPPEPDRDRFEGRDPNPLKVTVEEPVSTFSIDVDTASYAWLRRSLADGRMPAPEAVRVEELVNYFPYAYPAPESRDEPFATAVTVMPTPWNQGTKLLHIGIRGFDLPAGERPNANLVFLIDTSGSMNEPDKLPLLLDAFRLLLGGLRPEDQVAIVAYAGTAGVVLEPTAAAERTKILAALERLHAGGGTAGGEGILAAYALAETMRAEGETTRVILATDGDFNIGISDDAALTRLIEQKRDTGVFLSVLGFGQGNYNDALMQRLAQNGNGQAAYIDSLAEARKVLVEGVTGALVTIARDVKIQVEFNPATIAEYRLIGYETRALAREDFANDRVDAGEIGAGHTVTALYEITPVGSTARLT
ncbi:MAG TPA: von Willebrand factor type A domain-containing protein, partial [Paracoccaceae bacterium]|nr:von Willebrand factor type A domain-containing protein [Paracoccaceae bacterium]